MYRQAYRFRTFFRSYKFVCFYSFSCQVGGVLKLFLRDLPEPVFTYELYQCFVEAVRKSMRSFILMKGIADPKGRMHCLKQGISVLPPGNKAIISRLFKFFRNQALNEESSKMIASNIAIVFAPSLLRPEEETLETIMSEDAKKVIEILITEYMKLFVVKFATSIVLNSLGSIQSEQSFTFNS